MLMPMPAPPRRHCLARALLVSVAATLLAATQPCSAAELDLGVTQADLEPSVTVRETEAATVQEYRVNNRLYQVKITPSAGAPYYLIDEDGSGDMAWHRGAGELETNIPQWVLLSW